MTSGSRDRARQLTCLLIALLLHALVGLLPLSPFGTWDLDKRGSARNETDAIYVEKAEEHDRPVVRTSRARDDPAASDKPARFLGEFRNRVGRETQSPRKGAFEEGSGSRPEGHASAGEIEDPAGRASTLGMADLMPSGGANPYRLPDDIAKGSDTVLNTDSFVYASFINRISNEIYYPWAELARNAVDVLERRDRAIPPDRYVTTLVVSIDSEGGVAAIQVLKSCGVSELDDAAKSAIWESEPFPNPPNHLPDEEPLRLRYEFQLELLSSSFRVTGGSI